MAKTASGLHVPDSTPQPTKEDRTEEIKSVLISWVGQTIHKSYNRKSKDPNSFIIAATEIVNRVIQERQKLDAEGSDTELKVTFRNEAIRQIDELAKDFAAEIKNTYGINKGTDTISTIRTKLVLLGISYLQAVKNERTNQQPKPDTSRGPDHSGTAASDDGEKARPKTDSNKTKKAKGKKHTPSKKSSSSRSAR